MLFRFGVAPYLYGITHTNKFDVLFDGSHPQVALRDKETPVAIKCQQLNLADKLTEYLLLLFVPTVQTATHGIHLFVPYTFGVKYEACLEHILTEHQTLVTPTLQHFAESCRQEGTSFRVYFSLYIT